jgi:hypothetical protein
LKFKIRREALQGTLILFASFYSWKCAYCTSLNIR